VKVVVLLDPHCLYLLVLELFMDLLELVRRYLGTVSFDESDDFVDFMKLFPMNADLMF